MSQQARTKNHHQQVAHLPSSAAQLGPCLLLSIHSLIHPPDTRLVLALLLPSLLLLLLLPLLLLLLLLLLLHPPSLSLFLPGAFPPTFCSLTPPHSLAHTPAANPLIDVDNLPLPISASAKRPLNQLLLLLLLLLLLTHK
ncbi:hypothetical protein K504DRAFT_145911 [Pleomassaria siparia CBS 279.74]|uniref:Uncharacterized protein n=1 Tax=Pleomassaria siparia CBS 279.74 TaxID=1314801 RepID=A0A6G1KLH8_9PLEO|nr:hypothetical protein K504DRAFT_145911 [Pleomassaria siparia CBS 279.74]